jgi:hypothetical protein
VICPHCGEDIPDTELSKHLGSKGGKKSKGFLTPEAQAKMQEGRKAKGYKRKKKGA